MSKVVSFHSFARGAGRSTLVANLAYVLAAAGRRVGAVDVDFYAPSLHTLFGLREGEITTTLNDYLSGKCTLEQTAYDVGPALGLQPPGRLLVMPSSTSVAEIMNLLKYPYDLDALNGLLGQLDETFNLDYLLLDTTAGLTQESMLEMAISDVVVVLLRPDPPDFQGTAVSVEVARKLQVPDLVLVLNFSVSGLDTSQAAQELTDCFDCPVGAVLPDSEELLSLASTRLIAAAQPDSEYSLRLRQLAAQLLE
ncbi:MAG: MinD/ParA family protein [Chloroflexota bacterium]